MCLVSREVVRGMMAVCVNRISTCGRGGNEGTHNKILLVSEHKFRRVCIISAIWFVDNEFVFLNGENQRSEKDEHDNGKTG
jgi:hypothetical protein